MGVSVKVDTKGLDEVRKKMQGLRSLALTVGVQGKRAAKRYKGGANVASVGLFNEFGTRDIPQRSFIRGALFEGKSQIEAEVARSMEKFVFRPKADASAALSAVGRFVASKVKTRIDTTSHWARANAPSTIERKGFDRPLHETDLLSRSISWAVRTVSGSIIEEGPAR